MALAVSTPNIHTPATIDRALAEFDASLAELRDLEIRDSKHLGLVLTGVEAIKRKVHALSIDLLTASDQAGLHYQDGHTSAKVMTRHVNKLSGAEAAGRDKCRRMFNHLELIADAYRNGEIGTDQVMLLGRVFANPRVRGAMEGRQKRFIKDAKRLSYKRFQQRILEWERLIDEDGPEPPGDRAVENRTANINQNPYDLSWDLTANFPSVDGAFVNSTHRAYCKALFDLDWAEAKARVGDSVSMADLCRTNAQRKADALVQICADALANKDGMAPISMTHGVLWAQSTHEEMARRWAGAKPRPFDVDDYKCETIDGDPLDPTEAFAHSIVNKIRRVVVDAKGVVLDLGHARYFTGLTRDALRMTGQECFWPGCWLPATSCEMDHLHDHAKHGRTNPGNGAPGCGRHNRWRVVRLASLRLQNGPGSAVPEGHGLARRTRPDPRPTTRRHRNRLAIAASPPRPSVLPDKRVTPGAVASAVGLSRTHCPTTRPSALTSPALTSPARWGPGRLCGLPILRWS